MEMKDPTDKYTEDLYVDHDATDERLDQQVKEFLWDDLQKKFVPYPFSIEDRKEEDK
jgi:hypothetical protein